MKRLLFAICIAMAAVTGMAAPPRSIVLATTTSVDNSGLLPQVLAAFSRESGLRVDPIVVGSGMALQLLQNGDAQVALTHDPVAEQRLVSAGKTRFYQQFMWNEFVVAGPSRDPAHVRGAASAVEAFRRIDAARWRFCARNDSSGTSTRELQIWKRAGIDPRRNASYIPLGQGMAALLRSCSEMQGYALTDAATFEQLSDELELSVLYRGDPVLKNTYALLLPRLATTGERDRGAERFAKWLLSEKGKRAVESFRIKGKQAFFWLR